MWDAFIVLAILWWQRYQFNEHHPPYRWLLDMNDEPLVLPASYSRVNEEMVRGPISVWVNNDEFVFLVQFKEDPRPEDNSWFLLSISRNAIEEIILIGDELAYALRRLDFPEYVLKSMDESEGNHSIMILQFADEDRHKRLVAFYMNLERLPVRWYESALSYFRDRSHASIKSIEIAEDL